MNVKKMTTEHIQAVIIDLRDLGEAVLNTAQREYLAACEKELKLRWGIEG